VLGLDQSFPAKITTSVAVLGTPHTTVKISRRLKMSDFLTLLKDVAAEVLAEEETSRAAATTLDAWQWATDEGDGLPEQVCKHIGLWEEQENER
jgi:hypothetical protein